ncbi:MAG: alanine racemase [Acidobacteriota bacterium]
MQIDPGAGSLPPANAFHKIVDALSARIQNGERGRRIERVDQSLDALATPALVVDVERLHRNLADMADRCRRLGVRLRPHFKTPKSLVVAALQQHLGAAGFTVSTFAEARDLLDVFGATDVLWAVPLAPTRRDEALALHRRAAEAGRRLGLLVDARCTIDGLAQAIADSAPMPDVHAWLKIDCGNRRCGVRPDDPAAESLARRIHNTRGLRFAGLVSHSGQAYAARGAEALASIAEHERAAMAGAARRLRNAGLDVPTVSVGSTPAMRYARSLKGIDEARPGNYAYFDLMQVRLGACTVDEVAACVRASVISRRDDLEQTVIDAGALSLSRDDAGAPQRDGFGRILELDSLHDRPADLSSLDALPRIVGLSQEHGHVEALLDPLRPIDVLPIHSCLAVGCHDVVYFAQGHRVVAREILELTGRH